MFVFSSSKKPLIGLYVILMLIGASLIFIPTETLLNTIFTIIGIAIIALNAIPCYVKWNEALNNKKSLLPALVYTFTILLGLMFIFMWTNKIVSIIFGVWLIVLPVIRIIKSQNWKQQLKKEAPLLLVGALSLFIPAQTILGIIIKIFGGLIIVYCIVMIILLFKKDKNNNNDISGSSPNKSSSDDNKGIVIDADYTEIN
ncbi:MAG: hypothetical protein J6R47_06175 [Acholeplasmatales bacterium]|nr:hypothetical protein [Acholeplasmatales bacterium]